MSASAAGFVRFAHRFLGRCGVGLVVLTLGVAHISRGQCVTGWQPGNAVPGVNGPVYAITRWDPDGAGPQPQMTVVGGNFTAAGNVRANCVAAWNPTTGAWQAIGNGFPSPFPLCSGFTCTPPVVYALAVGNDGTLFAGGLFNTPARSIARWDGGAWVGLGTSGVYRDLDVNGAVYAMAVESSGNLVVGGDFRFAGGVAARGVARWNGTAWSSLAFNSEGTTVRALLALPSGDLVGGGELNGAPFVTRGSGLTTFLGTGLVGKVRALAALPGGDIVAGHLGSELGTTPVSRWNGTTWAAVGSGVTGDTLALAIEGNGQILAAGSLTLNGGAAGGPLRWNGTEWAKAAAAGPAQGSALLVEADGGIVVAGAFTLAGDRFAANVARLRPSGSWAALGSGLPAPVRSATILPGGDRVVGGDGIVARLTGSSWQPIGLPIGRVNALAVTPSGDLIAGGTFTAIGGIAANRVARWNGAQWTILGSGIFGTIQAAAVLPNGNIVVGGGFSGNGLSNIAQWDGSTWSSIGSGMNGSVLSLVVLPGGDLLAAGGFTTAGGTSASRVARWNGTSWSALGTGLSGPVNTLAVAPDGTIYAGGAFATTGGSSLPVARWTGTTWSTVGALFGPPALVSSLSAAPSGELYAAVEITAGSSDPFPRGAAFRWNGTDWISLTLSTTGGMQLPPRVVSAAPTGEVLVAGEFTNIDNVGRGYAAAFTPVSLQPTILAQPQSVINHPGGQPVSFSVTATASGSPGTLTYQWRKGGTPIDALANPTAVTPTLQIGTARPTDAGVYDCVVGRTSGNLCTRTSQTATLSLASCGIADVAGPGQSIGFDTFLTADDVIVFLQWFMAGDARADLAGPNQGSTPEGLLTADDIIVFLGAYFLGGC